MGRMLEYLWRLILSKSSVHRLRIRCNTLFDSNFSIWPLAFSLAKSHLPNSDYAPTGAAQGLVHQPVAGFVASQFPSPEQPVG